MSAIVFSSTLFVVDESQILVRLIHLPHFPEYQTPPFFLLETPPPNLQKMTNQPLGSGKEAS